ncbi:hypothetical protein DFQ30_008646 [Apophysomyces sp. BC1015]|nr:hypothetical protein DFQ30_008646 [Apophysomyces sp. BC1015]
MDNVALRKMAELLEVDATFSLTLDVIISSVSHTDRIQLAMSKNNINTDVGKLARIQKVMDDACKDGSNLDDCLALLNEIMISPPTGGKFAMLLSFAICSFAASMSGFGGSWRDGVLSGLLGGVTGLLTTLGDSYSSYGRVFEILSCIIISFVVRAMHSYVCFLNVALPSILVQLRGYGLTKAVTGIFAGHIPSGMVQLGTTLFDTLMLGYGLKIGSSLYDAIDDNPLDVGACGDPISPWFDTLLVPSAAGWSHSVHDIY